MNETFSAKVILYKSLYNAIFNMHTSKKFMKRNLFTTSFFAFTQSKLNDRQNIVMKSTRNSWTMNCPTGPSQPDSDSVWLKGLTAGLYKKEFGLSL